MSTAAARCSIPVYDVKLVQNRKPLRLAESKACHSEQAARVLHALIGATDREHFVCLFLNSQNDITGTHIAHVGGQSSIGTLDPRAILRAAISACACAMVIGHNHPSGDPTPSAEDIEATKRLAEVCRIVGIPILDHVIVTREATRYRAGWMMT